MEVDEEGENAENEAFIVKSVTKNEEIWITFDSDYWCRRWLFDCLFMWLQVEIKIGLKNCTTINGYDMHVFVVLASCHETSQVKTESINLFFVILILKNNLKT